MVIIWKKSNMPFNVQKPTDLRQHRRKMERTLVIAVVIALVGVGSLVIGIVYGKTAILTGLLCLLPGAGIFVALWLLLSGLEWLTRDKDS